MVKFIDFFEFEVCVWVVFRWCGGEVCNVIVMGNLEFDFLVGILKIVGKEM